MRLFSPETTHISDYFDRGKFRMAWRLTLLFFFLFGALSTAFIFINQTTFTLYFTVTVISAICFIYLKKTSDFIPVFWIYTVSGTILIFYSFNIVPDTVNYSEFFWLICVVILAFVGLGKTVGIAILCSNVFTLGYHIEYIMNTHIRELVEQNALEKSGIFVELVLALMTMTYLLNQYIVFQNYSKVRLEEANKTLADQNQVIQRQNEENLTLAKEIHHRVKNNLQIIVSLLRMHSQEVTSQETKKHFSEAINRIMAMSLIHQKLYQEKDLANIETLGYLLQLSKEIHATSSDAHKPIDFEITSEISKIGLKTIVPLGLLLTELITNSIKHAFQQHESGKINIHICEDAQQNLVLEYTDNGEWEAAESNVGGFGLELIELLTSQLEGRYIRRKSHYRFELANLDH